MNLQKKNINKQKSQQKYSSPNTKASKNESGKFLSYLIWIFKNIVIGVIFYIIIFQLIEEQQGYNWVYNSMLKENYKIIKKNKNLPLEQKLGSKFGFNFFYWKHIIDNTPEDAVILYPNKEIFFPEGQETKFGGEPYNKIYASRFLYPRKLVYPTEIEVNRYGKQITHVAIVNGWGYDYLEYETYHVDNTILPIRLSENQTDNNEK